MKSVYYKIGQNLPPRHWYQKPVGWFGKGMALLMALTVLGVGAYDKVMQQGSTVRASQSERLEKLHKATQPLSSSTENIIDVQFVLDKWAKEKQGETWSVTARSIDGPKIQAHIQGEKSYESTSVGQLLLTLPLFSQIPAEQHANIKLDSGKTMATCVNLMVRLGDTDCGNEVAGYVDFRKVDSVLQKVGIKKTSFTGTKARTTSDDVAAFLAAVQGDTLQKGARDAVLKSLREQQVRTGIPAACPGCLIANEASDTGVVHDAAIVQYAGGTYVLSIFTKDGSLADISELAGRIQQKIIDTAGQ